MERFELSEKEINNSVESILKEHSMGLNYLEEKEEDDEEITNANKGSSRIRKKHRKGLDYLRDK